MKNGKDALIIERVTTEDWEVFFNGAANRIPFSSPVWSRTIAEVAGLDAEYICVSGGNLILAGVCIYSVRKGKRKFMKHPPFTPYNSVIFRNSADLHGERTRLNEILEALAGYLAKEYIYPYLLLDPSVSDARHWQWNEWNVSPGYTYLVDPFATVIDQDIRRRSRRCTEEGFYVKQEFDAEAFAGLFLQTAERQKIKVRLDRSSFIALLRAPFNAGLSWMMSSFDRSGVLHASWIQMSCDGHSLFNWNAASNASLLGKGGTPFLVTNLLERIKNENYKTWDLCGADTPSVARFKSGLGGMLTPYFKVSYSKYSLLEKISLRIINR